MAYAGGQKDGLYLSIDGGSFFRLGGEYDGYPERYAHLVAIRETMRDMLKKNGK